MIKIEIKGYDDFVRKIGTLVVNKHIDKAIKKSIITLQRGAMKETPRDTSNLISSYETRFKPLEGTLRNTAKYGLAIHEGTRPHYVPIKAIERWAKRKGINPYAVAKSIQKKGTKANPFFERGIEKEKGKVDIIFSKEFDKLFDKLK